ncbi:hypothetical protein KVF89_22300 [Nocardioides carbamazepini]|uniref:hypothetical protein n=1 Tax=Nocardioides carbamazepini TaxID=2854259 RepID=UPI00214A80D7|nr:hypothetical protein [Nocardioides carbamazepini]MCR1785288.1 hypothetical protein [Nocardioides carbamazepini]
MQRHELDAWLGDFADTLTGDQKDDLAGVIDAITCRYSDEDDERRDAAVAGATSLALGDLTLEDAADAWRTAREAERAAMAALTGAILMADQEGDSEASIVKQTRVNRMTIRKALGKQ